MNSSKASGVTSACERVICRVTYGGVSNKVIYLCAVSVDAHLDGLWASTLTEHGPGVKVRAPRGFMFSREFEGVKCKKCVVMEVGECVSIPHLVSL